MNWAPRTTGHISKRWARPFPILYRIAILTSAFMCAPPALYAQANAGALIDEIIAAYGGAPLLAVRSYRMEAVLQARARGETGEVIRIAEGRRRLKVLIRYPTTMEIRVLDGERAWRGASPRHLTLVQGPPRTAMVLQAARADLPWILKELRSKARVIETKDKSLMLAVPIDEGMVLRVTVDPKTHRIVRSDGAIRMGSAEVSFET
ncbi:MAG: hypothetical protein ACM3TN_18300, partial [Alphaproteobacteria bacterium]